MSNNINRMKRNKLTGKKMGILAAAALTAALITGSVPVVTEPVSAAESQEKVSDALIPDNITIDQPTELANIALPITEHGTLEWADGSFVPTQRVQACEVLLIPAEGQDLSHAEGWDSETGAVVGYINVVVNGIDDSSSTDAPGDSEDTKDQETPSETPAEEEKNTSDNKDGKSDEVNSAGANKDNTDKENKDENSKKENDTQNDKDKNSKENSTDKSSDSADVTGKLEIADDTTQDTADEKKNDSDNTDSKDDNIFDNPVLPDEKDNRPTDVEDNLSDEEKEERAEINHTCDGITVSGANLPWYVQFRVSSGDSYQFTNESDAMIFQSYEFELWDLQNDTEYEIPSGEYVSVTVPVKSGYEYTIEHLLDNGATETIIPNVEDGIMVFSTHSFSPFGIAGSRQLVGPDTGDDSNSAGTVTPTPASSDTQEQSSDTGKNNTVSINTNSDNNNTSSLSAQTDSSSGNETAKNNNAVNTGDTTTILPFVILVVAAAVIIGVVVFVKKKKK